MSKLNDCYKEVFKDLMKHASDTDLLKGTYDATNGCMEYMYGIYMVMRNITSHLDEETEENYESTFFENMLKSEKQAEKKKKKDKK